MRGRWLLILAGAPLVACASPDVDVARVPLCGPLASLAPLPAPQSCDARELAEFSAGFEERLGERAQRAMVRVEFDVTAAVKSLCVEKAPGYGSDTARRALAENLDAILAAPPAPACLAGHRLDLHRYEAKLAEAMDRQTRCQEQTRITRETQGGPTTVRNAVAPGAYGVYEREYERCLERDADWIALDAPGSARPAIFVKPEVPEPPGPPAYDTASRCLRESKVFEKRAACIESEGWERLEPLKR
ncbi:MAG TPA: hypothetical protein VKH41_16195 [Myxococcota bacterium]|nr:hypothetical protein [Myxococcota bacterium]